MHACMRERETETEEDEGRVRGCRYRRTSGIFAAWKSRDPERCKRFYTCCRKCGLFFLVARVLFCDF